MTERDLIMTMAEHERELRQLIVKLADIMHDYMAIHDQTDTERLSLQYRLADLRKALIKEEIDGKRAKLTGSHPGKTVGDWTPIERALFFARGAVVQRPDAIPPKVASDFKSWIIDQMVRALTGDEYEEWIKEAKRADDGPDYEWEEGRGL